jgi:hypothetical protein
VLVVRDAASIRAFDLVVAAASGHTLPVFALLIRATGIAALPAVVIGELQIDAFVAAGDQARSSAATVPV